MTPTDPDSRTTDLAEEVPLRASNADRERVSVQLHDAATTGMLSMSEVEERLGILYAARFRHELTPLFADLPADGTAARQVDRVESVREGARRVVFATAALILAIVALAKRNRIITAVVVVAVIAAMVALVVFGGFEMGGHHEMDGIREFGER